MHVAFIAQCVAMTFERFRLGFASVLFGYINIKCHAPACWYDAE